MGQNWPTGALTQLAMVKKLVANRLDHQLHPICCIVIWDIKTVLLAVNANLGGDLRSPTKSYHGKTLSSEYKMLSTKVINNPQPLVYPCFAYIHVDTYSTTHPATLLINTRRINT